ncbi:PRC-barrel domain-containing protein [Rhizobium sp.]|uniref:PRC-barrel domain-containing protein n=1 Tax=Rhizobium sp. TaxID=391 RepID=UPI0028B13264
MSEIFLQHLIGKQVLDQQDWPIGRIEEVVAERAGNDVVVTEYHLGTFALVERLSAGEIGRSILRFFGAGRGDGLAVPWKDMDLSSPDHPRITCDASELRAPKRDA